MACSTCANDTLQLIGLYPNNLFYPLVAPDAKTIAGELHCTTSHPKKYHPILMDITNLEIADLVISERAIRQLHVNIPWRVCHNHADLAVEDFQRKCPHVTLYPLRRYLCAFQRSLVDTFRICAPVLNTTI